jgi:hypothetical protein
VVIKVLFVVLILSTAAIVAVGIAIHLRVQRHFDGKTSEVESLTATDAPVQDEQKSPLTGADEEIDHGQSSDKDAGHSG